MRDVGPKNISGVLPECVGNPWNISSNFCHELCRVSISEAQDTGAASVLKGKVDDMIAFIVQPRTDRTSTPCATKTNACCSELCQRQYHRLLREPERL
jgi:hypothetical protein